MSGGDTSTDKMGGGASLAAGRYEVVSVLGESNCTVYHARDTATGADVRLSVQDDHLIVCMR